MSDSITLARRTIKPSEVKLPGSKSISNRCLLLAALSESISILEGVLDSDDTRYMLSALGDLGVVCEQLDEDVYKIQGVSGRFPVDYAHLFLGNAGTAFRPLTAVLALQNGSYELDGVQRMRQRPIGDLVDALNGIGCDIDYLGEIGYPPIIIKPMRDNMEKRINISGKISSQFLTSLLMALPLTGREFEIAIVDKLISKPYIDITIKLLKKFGIEVENRNYESFHIPGGQAYKAPEKIHIEADASGASYFAAAGYLTCTPIKLMGISGESIQGDVKFINILEKMGAETSWDDNSVTVWRKPETRIPGFEIDALDIPDAAMTFCIIALMASGTSKITNIASWKVKETDRILAMKAELEKLGAEVSCDDNSITINPPKETRNLQSIKTYDDHRMAMCFSLVSLIGADVIIEDPSCVNKTFPTFFEVFESLKA